MSAAPGPSAQPSPEKLLRDLLDSAEQASAARQTMWRLYESFLSTSFEMSGPSGTHSSSSTNPGVPAYRKYGAFFDAVTTSLFQSMTLAVCRIFDDGPEKVNLHRYLDSIEHRLGPARVKDFKKRLQPLKEAVERVRSGPRNLAVAHTSMHHTAEDVFRADNLLKLISVDFLDRLAAILNELRDEAGIQQDDQVSTDDRYEKAASGVLSALIYGLPSVEKNGAVRMRIPMPYRT